MPNIHTYPFRGKQALIRVDFNVPLSEDGKIMDATRIHASLPTIQHVLREGGSVVLVSHLGRPCGYDKALSLEPIADYLAELLQTKVLFWDAGFGGLGNKRVIQLKPGEVMLLENMRFHTEEISGSRALAGALSTLGDVYINDAFATAHRKHTSAALVAAYFEDRFMGLLMEKEVRYADRLLRRPVAPFTLIVGGNKVRDKLRPIVVLLSQANHLLAGGSVGNTFLSVQGKAPGLEPLEQSYQQTIQRVLRQADEQEVPIILPQDIRMVQTLDKEATATTASVKDIPKDWQVLDIGPATEAAFVDIIRNANTLLWCGPMGLFEDERFASGTRAIAQAIAEATEKGAFSLIGGGDSAAAVKRLGYADQVSYISTGGSALLHYLGDMPMPGLLALQGYYG